MRLFQTADAIALGEDQLRSALPLITLGASLGAAAGAFGALLATPAEVRWWSLPAHLCLSCVALYWLRRPPRNAHLAASLVAAYFFSVVGSLLWSHPRPPNLLLLGVISFGCFYFILDRRYLIALQAFGFAWLVAALVRVYPQATVFTTTITVAIIWAGGLAIHLGRGRVLEQLGALRRTLDRQHEELRAAERALDEETEARRRVQEQAMAAQKLESLGVMAGGVAHDFNNLLVAILGGAEVASDAAAPTAAREEAIGLIRASSLTARELCRQLLDFAGSRPAVREPTDLNRVVQDALRLASAALPAGVAVESDLTEAGPWVVGDRTQLQQVVVNLVSNAAEAMETPTGLIRVATRVAGNRVRIAVRDQGRGIDATTLERIYDPFFTTKATGRGLGLSTALGVVRSHGGALRVASTGPAGTCFEVDLPASERTATPRAIEPSRVPMRGTGRILLVDDQDSVLAIGRSLLERMGFEVETARSGEQAISTAATKPTAFVCAIVDATMPGIDGPTTIQRLRAIVPTLPIVLCSGVQSETQSNISGPEIRFLAKPYRRDELASVLTEVLGEPPPRRPRPAQHGPSPTVT